MTTRQASTGVGLAFGFGLLLTMALSDVLAQAPPPPFSMHSAPRPLPEIQFENGQGEAMSLADFRGKVVLLNIWATWCAPCRREMPTLDRLQAELGGPDFQVVALSLDRKGLPAVKQFYEELGLQQLGMYVDASGKAQRELSVLGIPTTLLLDRDGNEIGRLLGPAEWDSPEMVSFIRGYVERQSGAPLGPASEEVLLAFAAVRPGEVAVWSRPSFQRLEGTTCNAGKEILRWAHRRSLAQPSRPWPRTGCTRSDIGCAVRDASPPWSWQRSRSAPRSIGAGSWPWASPRFF